MKIITKNQTILIEYKDGHTRLSNFGSFLETISGVEVEEFERLINTLATEGETHYQGARYRVVDLLFREYK